MTRGTISGAFSAENAPATTTSEPGAGNRPRNNAQTETILTAHFLKSVCFDIGSVASSVALLMSWLASNHGTNTTPRGIRFRPRVSMRVRISPRLETIFTSAPWLNPAFASILGMHEAECARESLIELWHPHGHGSGMPVF